MSTILLNNKFEVDFNFAFVGKKNLFKLVFPFLLQDLLVKIKLRTEK